jgi:hypothetical protein
MFTASYSVCAFIFTIFSSVPRSSLLLIDDVWSTSMWDQIIRIIVTSRFQAVARTCTGDDNDSIQNVRALDATKSEELFRQAISESKGNKDVEVPEEVWKMCGGLPLAIVTMAGHVACSPPKSPEEWRQLCSTLLPDSTKDRGKDVTKEEVGRHDMPAETKTPESMEVREKNLTQEEAGRNDISSETKTRKSAKDRGKDLTQEEAGRIISHCYNDSWSTYLVGTKEHAKH